MKKDRLGYEAYLRSPEWAEKRKQRLVRDGRRCTGCGDDGSDSRLEVHHLTYERFGSERLEDLVTLCNLCHAREHGRSPLVGPVAGPTRKQIDERTELLRQQESALSGTELPLWERVTLLRSRAESGDPDALRALRLIFDRVNIAERVIARKDAA